MIEQIEKPVKLIKVPETSNIPTISTLCKEIGVLPGGAVLVGMATDELPVLFNISNTNTPNIVVWDGLVGQGLKLIKTMIEFILGYKRGFKTEFIIMSNNSNEWRGLSEHGLGVWDKDACIAIVPFWDSVSDQVLFALSGWISGIRRGTKSPIILFIDGLENIDKMSKESRGYFEQILLFGREKNIFVVATAKSGSREKLARWFEYFTSEIYGQDSLYWFEMNKRNEHIVFFAPITEI